MEVELILAAGELGIDRDRNILARQRPPELGGERVARGPGEGEIVRRSGIERERVLDPGDAARRDGEELGDSDAVLQQRDALVLAVRQIDPLAGRRPLPRLGVRHALAVNDGPQRQPIGARRRGAHAAAAASMAAKTGADLIAGSLSRRRTIDGGDRASAGPRRPTDSRASFHDDMTTSAFGSAERTQGREPPRIVFAATKTRGEPCKAINESSST